MTDATSSYAVAVAQRLQADKCTLINEDWGGGRLVGAGYKRDFRPALMATLHLFTFVEVRSSINEDDVERFTIEAQDRAIDRPGRAARGNQTGVMVLPCLISASVDPAAAAYASRTRRLRWAAEARPVVVDTTTGVVSAFRGTKFVGMAMAGYLRRKINLYFPTPA